MSIPNPLSWLADIPEWVGGAAGGAFEAMANGLMRWIMSGVLWVVSGIFNFFLDAEDPNVQADWFAAGHGPYVTMTAVAAMVMVGFLLAGITQGVLSGDIGGMLRRIALDLPISVLGIVGLVTATQVLIRLTDELSTHVMSHFREDIAHFEAVMLTISHMANSGAVVVFVLGLATILAGIVLVAELAIRAALIYVVVALAPLVFAARLWPALQGACRKLLELLCALVISKLVMAVALAVAASATVGTGSGGEVTALPEPEVLAEDPGGSVTQTVGILLAATAAFGVAAFSPWLVAKLLPITESAAVAQGLRSGPYRTGQSALSTAYSARLLTSSSMRRLAVGGIGAGAAGPGGSAAGAGGVATAAAGPGAVAAAGIANATRRMPKKAAQSAEQAMDSSVRRKRPGDGD